MARRKPPAQNGSGPTVKYDQASTASRALNRLRDLGIDVKTVSPNDKPTGQGPPVPHIITFSGYATQLGRVYRNPDEAWRDSKENARYMRNDLSIMECMDARQLGVALMPWQIDADGDNSSTAKELVQTMTQILRKVPRFTEYRRSLQDAVWYGRSAIQHSIGHVMCRGRRIQCLKESGKWPAWAPISGDKLAFPYDRQGLGIRIGFGMPTEKEGVRWSNTKALDGSDQEMFWDGERYRKVEMTSEYGRVFWLDEDELERVNLHKHFIEDAAFETPLQAGRLHGVGVRDRVYWTWFIKQNTSALLTEYLERSAFGFEIWTYPMGNNEALQAVETAAKTRSGFGKNIVFVPIIPGQEGLMDFQHQEIGAQGMDLFNSLVHEYYEWQIKRFILGQIQSSEPVGGGLGQAGLADLQGRSLANILLYDAQNQEESITNGLLNPLRERNRHLLPIKSDSIELYFRINTKADESQKIIEGITSLHTMGLPIKADSLYEIAGVAKPLETDPVLLNGQPPKSLEEHAEDAARRVQVAMPGMPGQQPPGEPGQPGGGPNSGGDQENSPPGTKPPPGETIPPEDETKEATRETPARYSYSELADTWDTVKRPDKYTVEWNGLTIGIENRAGTRRRPEWEPMAHDYGEIKKTSGKDGDAVDVFLGPDLSSQKVFVIDQETQGGRFDEHKCMLGFDSPEAACAGYLANYEPGWHVGPVTEMSVDQFKAWIAEGDTTARAAKQAAKFRRQQYFATLHAQTLVPEKCKATTGWPDRPERYVRDTGRDRYAEFKEEDHPRADDGKFGSGGGGGSDESDDHDQPEPAKKTPEKRGREKPRAIRGEMFPAIRTGKGKEAKIALEDGTELPHITPAMVPPAWSNVQVSRDPDADVLVTAKDAKGKSKIVYNEKFSQGAQAAKFANVMEGIAKRHKILDQNQANRSNPELADNADCTWLMLEQATRPGSEADTKGLKGLMGVALKPDNIVVTEPKTKGGKPSVTIKIGDKTVPVRDEGTKAQLQERLQSGKPIGNSDYWLKSFGATTLEAQHVIEDQEGVRLQFVGKEGVWHDHQITNPELADMLRQRKASAKQRGGKLFNTDYDSVVGYAKDLDGGKFTPKDFRTMKATSLAIEEVKKQPEPPKDDKEYKSRVMQIAEKVSRVLGNRAAQALESYISPTVFAHWRTA